MLNNENQWDGVNNLENCQIDEGRRVEIKTELQFHPDNDDDSKYELQSHTFGGFDEFDEL